MMTSAHFKIAAVLMIAAFIIPDKLVDSFNASLSSINIFDEHAITELQNPSSSLHQNTLVDMKQEKIETEMLDRKVNPMKVVEIANMVMGFVTGFMSIFDFIKGKTDGKDKHSIDDVMATLEREFNSINAQLDAIASTVSTTYRLQATKT